jgi:hypothetical protein
MKKRSVLVIVIAILLVIFSGCTTRKPITNGDNNGETNPDIINNLDNDNENGGEKTETNYVINDFYPFKANVKYEFEGTGMEYASFNVWVDYLKENRIQLRTNNGGTEIVRVLENKDGELRVVFSSPEETYYREDFTNKASEKIDILLKEPLVQGTEWTTVDGNKRYISKADAEIETPLGSFKTLEVTTEAKDYSTLDYYVLDKGLVRTVFKAGDFEVVSTLSKIEENSPLLQNVKFYYPGTDGNKIYSSLIKLSFNTNDITKFAFEKAFREPPKEELVPILSPNSRIKSMYLNKDNMVYVDFTKELITETNLGAGYEALMLQSLVNTIGQYYGAEKVYITVEDGPYKSGHITKRKGEPFIVDLNNVVELD